MRECRKQPREQLDEYCLLLDSSSNVPFGEILDLSREGLRIQSGNPIVEMAALQCKMKMPRTIDGRQEISFSAWCVWCERDAEGSSHQAGLRITAISNEDADVLTHYLESAARKAPSVNA